MLAPTKQERDAKTAWGDLAKNNKNKKQKKGANEAKDGNQVDFAMIRKFTDLKLSAPLS